MILETAHDEAVNGVDDKNTSFSFFFDGFHAIFDESVSLVEIGSLFIHQSFLILLELSLIHKGVCNSGKTIPT